MLARIAFTLVALLVTSPARALTLDDFEGGPLASTSLGNGTFLGMASVSAIGGGREIYGRTIANLDLTSGDDFIRFRLSRGVSGVQAGGSATLSYDGAPQGVIENPGALGLDLSGMRRFEVDLTSAGAAAITRVSVLIRTSTGVSQYLATRFFPVGRQTLALDFADFTDSTVFDDPIQQIRLQFGNSSTSSFGDATVDVFNFSAVPEPGAALLLGLAAFGLARRTVC